MDVRTGFFGVMLVALGGLTVLMVAPFAQYLAGAALLAFLLTPLHHQLEPAIGARLSALALVSATLVIAIVPLVILSAVVIDTVRQFAADPERIVVFVEALQRVVIEPLALEIDLLEELEQMALQFSERMFEEMLVVLTTTVRIGVGALLMVFVLYYFLVDGTRFMTWLERVTPLDEETQTELIEETRTITWAVLQSHLFVAVIEGILGGIALYLLGVPNALFWTAIMIVVSILPLVGVWIVWAPAVLYLFVVDRVFGGLVLFIYGVTLLAFVDEYLRAIFVDHRSGLNPATVLVGVLGGLYMFGVVGLFLGPILLAVFKAFVNVFSRSHGFQSVDNPADPESSSPNDGT